MMKIPIWQIDAFADGPFTGNPAAVCLLPGYPSDQWMQNVAAEMNLSETAFVVPIGDGNRFHLRWFTPATEVDLCGHATLAAAHTLIEQGHIEHNELIRFQTLSGELACRRSGQNITLDFPMTPATDDVDAGTAKSLRLALGLDRGEVLQTQYDLVVICDDEKTVVSMQPDFNALGQIETRGVIATAATPKDGIDFVSRFFAPRCGINEDPVTGSAHCCLAPYWSAKRQRPFVVGYQASIRGGTVHCEIVGNRVRLSGKAVTVMEGFLMVPVQ